MQPLPLLSLPEYHNTSAGHAGHGELPGSTHSGRGVIPGLSHTESGPSLTGCGEVLGSTHSGHGVIPGLSHTESGPSLTDCGEVPGSTHSGHGVIPGLSHTESGPSLTDCGEVPGSTHSGRGVIPGLSHTESGPSLTDCGEVPGSTHSGRGVIPGLSQTEPEDVPGPSHICHGYDDPIDHLFPVSRKRMERSSPLPSPSKFTRSPLPKIQRRLRTGTEGRQQETKPSIVLPVRANRHTCHHKKLTLSDFVLNTEEAQARHELQKEMNVYVAHRVAVHRSGFKYPFLGMQDYYAVTRPTHTEQSHVVYLEVLDAIADRKETMMGLLHSVKKTFIEERKMQWLVLEGDAKLYEILKCLTFEYGEDLNWLIPYPGDFHLLLNFQKALMKPYFDSGLKAMAQKAGYPLAAIQTCSQFERTHHFILEMWEAIYRVMLLKYEEQNPTMSFVTGADILAISTDNFPLTFHHHLHQTSLKYDCYFEGFQEFIQKIARMDSTWR